MLFRQVVRHVAFLVDLAALQEGGLASVQAVCRMQGLGADYKTYNRGAVKSNPRAPARPAGAPSTASLSRGWPR